ncbi:MAG: RHS repeat-associated core domain-containing protein [Verrucomicrobiota bacterium]|nr:RHS repeat-associated core domain-containing protein [Verrucomicrobiota bacterium]
MSSNQYINYSIGDAESSFIIDAKSKDEILTNINIYGNGIIHKRYDTIFNDTTFDNNDIYYTEFAANLETELSDSDNLVIPAYLTTTYETGFSDDYDGYPSLPNTVKKYAIETDGSAGTLPPKLLTQTNYTYSYTPNVNGAGNTVQKTIASETSPVKSLAVVSSSSIYTKNSSQSYLRDMPYSTVSPFGAVEAYVYSKGTYNPDLTFTCNDGPYFRIVKLLGNNTTTDLISWDGQTIEGMNLVDKKSYLDVTIKDYRGYTIRTERRVFQTGKGDTNSCDLISYKNYTYTKNGSLKSTVDNKGLTYTAHYYYEGTENENGLKEYQIDELGVRTTYAYNQWNLVTTETISQEGTPTDNISKQPNSIISYDYDFDNRVKSKTVANQADGTGKLTSTWIYDGIGRLTSKSEQGYSTSYAYSGVDTITDETYPDGTTKRVEKYADGKLKEITGTAVVPEYHTYRYEAANNGTNMYYLVHKVNYGTANSARWSETWADDLGNTCMTIMPSESDGSLVITYSYGANGLIAIKSVTGLSNTFYSYNSFGELEWTCSDLDNDGIWDLNGPDRVYYSESTYTKSGNDWWIYAANYNYPDTNSATRFITDQNYTRLTGFTSNCIEEYATCDSGGNWSQKWVQYFPAESKVVVTQSFPGVTNGETNILHAGLLRRSISPAGVQVDYEYDASGRLTSTKDNTGITTYSYYTHTVPVTYYPVFYLTSHVDGPTYDNYYTDAQGTPYALSELTVNQNGTPNDTSDDTFTATINTTKLLSVHSPYGVDEVTYDYDSAGRLKSEKNANNKYKYYNYNSRGQLTQTWGDVPYPVEYGYDDFGDRTQQYTYRGGTWTSPTWPGDAAHTGADLTQFTFEGTTGLLKEKTDAQGKKTSYTYNARNQLKSRTWQRGITTTYNYYDGADGVAGRTGELKEVQYPQTDVDTEANATGTIVGTIQRNTNLTYTYNRRGQLSQVVDAAGTRQFLYRSSGSTKDYRLSMEDLPAPFYGTATPNDRSLSYGYDSNDRLNSISLYRGSDSGASNEFTNTYTYHATTGRLDTIGSGQQTYTYGYKANTNLIDKLTTPLTGSEFSQNYTQTRTYEPNRNLLSSIDTTALGITQARYQFWNDNLRRRQDVVQTGKLFERYGASLATSGLTTYYSYDDRNELTDATTRISNNREATGATVINGRDFDFRYDSFGNRQIASTTNEGGEQYASAPNYTVNNLNQYTARTNPSELIVSGFVDDSATSITVAGQSPWRASAQVAGSDFYQDYVTKAPDSDGAQRITITASKTTTPVSNATELVTKLVRPNAESFVYDDDGNMLQDGLFTYDYDAENRLAKAWKKANWSPAVWGDSGSVPARIAEFYGYRYDYMGRRIEVALWQKYRPVGGTGSNDFIRRLWTKRYIYEGWNMVEELDVAQYGAEPSLKRLYTWGLDLAGSFSGAGGIGGLLEIQNKATLLSTDAGTYLTVFDGNGNLTGLISTVTKGLVAEYEYDPFGGMLRETGRPIAFEQPFRFATKTYDRETELCNFGFRHYHTSLGRFINRDPIEERGGWALFKGLNYGMLNPFYGNRSLNATNFLAEYGSRQDEGLKNTSLAHSTETIGTGQPKNSSAKWERDLNTKFYSANANSTGHVGQGGSSGIEWHTPDTSVRSADPWNRDANLYVYAGNDPINSADALGLNIFRDVVNFLGGTFQGLLDATTFQDSSQRPGGDAFKSGLIAGNMLSMPISAQEIVTGGTAVVGGTLTTPEGGLLVAAVGATQVAHGVVAGSTAVQNVGKIMSDKMAKIGPGKPFSPSQKRQILDANREKNGGKLRSDKSGDELVPSKKSESGVTPDSNEAQVDHINPKSNGGSNSPENAQVLSRKENREKSNKIP